MPEILPNKEIVERLLTILGHTNASLVRELGVSKQSLNQFTKQKGIDINNKIISLLILEIERLNR